MRILLLKLPYTYFVIFSFFCGILAGDAVHNLAFADNSVEVEVTGSIKAYCANSSSTTQLKMGDATIFGASTVAFTVDCNAPFQYSMQSANGALRLADGAGADTATGEIPYRVRVRIPLTYGGEIDDTCNSASIRAGAVTCNFTDSGDKIAIGQRAEARLSWPPPKQQITSGVYQDKITIQIRLQI